MGVLICILWLATFVTADYLTKTERDEVLYYHNYYRGRVNPSAADMMDMEYSMELERQASDWANRCIFGAPDPRTYPAYKGLGLNMMLIQGAYPSVTRIAAYWYKTGTNYHYETNSCDPGKDCRTYTQMVWGKSKEIGCGIRRCDGRIPGPYIPTYLFFCLYKPTGNYKGVLPYTKGRTCSACPAGTHCVSNLCSKKGAPIQPPKTTTTAPGVTRPPADSAYITQEERNNLLVYHNNKRSGVNPTASDMMKLEYDMDLEKLASQWVDRCKFEHPDPKIYTQYKGVGQNLAVTGGYQRDVLGMAARWHSEVNYYDYYSNWCTPGKMCGHYTQMVWGSTTAIGCAVKRCDGRIPGMPSPTYLMACQYKPPGNYAGQKPYKNGWSCSACPTGTRCESNLCVRTGAPTQQPKPTTTAPGVTTSKTTTQGPAPPVSSDYITQEERNSLLSYHNDKRSSVMPTASDMRKLMYDMELEKLASKWVERCEFAHPDPKIYREYKDTGQNLAVTGGSRRDLLAMAARWHSEVSDYDYNSNSCKPGKLCGHYTQMVWSSTKAIGCAVKRCDGRISGMPSPTYLLACQYRPPGNYVGKKPYKKGKSCSSCPILMKCESNLCTKK